MCSYVSIHAPRRGSDENGMLGIGETDAFQSTLPAGGATGAHLRVLLCTPGFNPRSPQGERRSRRSRSCTRAGFNPRSPQGERPGETALIGNGLGFNPRSPQGERHPGLAVCTILRVSIHAPRRGSDFTPPLKQKHSAIVSIHAPRRGSDSRQRCDRSPLRGFNPRSPQGERHEP